MNAHGAGLAEQRELATKLLRLFLPQILFYGIVALSSALLNARRRFAAAAFAPVLNNVVTIVVFLLLPEIASGSLSVHRVLSDNALVLLLGLGTTVGVVITAVALLAALRHTPTSICVSCRHGATPRSGRCSAFPGGRWAMSSRR